MRGWLFEKTQRAFISIRGADQKLSIKTGVACHDA